MCGERVFFAVPVVEVGDQRQDVRVLDGERGLLVEEQVGGGWPLVDEVDELLAGDRSGAGGGAVEVFAQLGGGLGELEALFGDLLSGAPVAGAQLRVGGELREGVGERVLIAWCDQQSGLLVFDHFWDADEPGGDDRQRGGHRLHDDGGKNVAGAFAIDDRGQGEDVAAGELCLELVVATASGEADLLLAQLEAGAQFVQAFRPRTVAGDGALEAEAAVAQIGAGHEQVVETFELDQAADGEDAQRLALAGSLRRRGGEAGGLDAVVDAVDFFCRVGAHLL